MPLSVCGSMASVAYLRASPNPFRADRGDASPHAQVKQSNLILRASSSSSSQPPSPSSTTVRTHNQKSCQPAAFGRREAAALGLGVLFFSISDFSAEADTGAPGAFNKYIKRKKLDPLDTYIPPVILSQSQFQDLEVKLLSDNPEYGDSRSYLRAGPASSLRSNIRAVAQYASEAGDGKSAFEAVEQCIGSLEDLDSLLLRASRNDSSATVQKMKDKIDLAVLALDRLLATVPSTVLEKCKAIAASYRDSSNPSGTEQVEDANVKLLESLL